jgi:hypothetical protein
MSNRTIGGTLHPGLLDIPPAGICQPCYATYRATKPRPVILWCWHSRTLARQRRDGSWKVLEGVTPHELRELQAGTAHDQL